MRTCFFTFLIRIDVWLEVVEADSCMRMSFTPFADWVIDKVRTPGAAAFSSVTDSVHVVVSGSHTDLRKVVAVRGRLDTKSNGRTFQVLVAAVARLGEHREHCLLWRMPRSLTSSSICVAPVGPLISPFLRDTEPLRAKRRAVLDSFRTSAAMRLEQIMYTASIIVTCYATESGSKKRFRVEYGGFWAIQF